MTTWLWIIGLTAIIWPIVVVVVLLNYVEANIGQRLLNLASVADANFNNLNEKISKTHRAIEKQDELIAALWAETYGYSPEEDDRMISISWMPLNEAWGIRPKWKVRVDLDNRSEDSLERKSEWDW